MNKERSCGDLLEEELGLMEGVQRAMALLAKEMLEAAHGAIFGADLLAIGALNRSTAHCAGIKPLIETRNVICAGPILRLQLDTALRFYAIFLVDDPNDFAMSVLESKPINKMKSKDGSQLQDAYLMKAIEERFPERYPWVASLYKGSSGYIHFSEKHLFSAIFPDENKGFKCKVSPLDPEASDELMLEMLEAFYACTDMLGDFVTSWISHKKYVIAGAMPPRQSQA